MDVCEMFAKRLGNVALIEEVWKASCPSLDLWIFPRVAAQAADGWPISLFLSLSPTWLVPPLFSASSREEKGEDAGREGERARQI